MFKIMIVKIPRGEAPEWVRRAWLGIVLPCIGKFPSGSAVGALTGKPADQDQDGYNVPQDLACELLAQHQPSAAEWWQAHGYPKPGHTFVFYEDEVMVPPGDEGRDAWG